MRHRRILIRKSPWFDFFTASAGEQDDSTDNETLPSGNTGEEDDYTFDESAEEEDDGGEQAQLVVAVNGLVAANDNVNSTETLTFQETDHSTDNIDDPGTEEDAPADDTEEDTYDEDSEESDTLTLGDVLDSNETVTAPDGTVTKTTIDGSSTDNIVADETDTALDQHTANVSPPSPGNVGGEVDTDATRGTDKTTLTDTSNGNSTVKVTVSQPVANGTLQTVSTLLSTGNATVTDVSGSQ